MKNQKKVLIIEDDEAVIRPLEIALRLEGLSLLIAKDGEEALKILENNLPDLILLDIILPKINGFEVLEKIKSGSRTKNIPVIILSNLAREGEIRRGLMAGVEDYFVKTNFSLPALIERIKSYL